ncbi:MAG: 2,3-bisphosphoglycerate-independent phosphoglycerate mutase [Patescibacteria group bacterium]|nr:2,3-bisphosphoglycerate-independent phosphoglycerate mutase [Patescibacteria group bacterium]
MNHKYYKKVILVIFDGFGVAPDVKGNAIARAQAPALRYLINNFPSLTLQASGPLVGLPWGEMGNSEVGHLNLGAGRIVGQDLPRITAAIQSREIFKNPVFLAAIQHAQQNNSNLHLIGMVSPGGVHSFDEHLYALLGLLAEQHFNRVYIHMFTDGRDTEPKVAIETLKRLRAKIEDTGVGQVATITGRFYGMDRGGHWNQTFDTYAAMVEGKGESALSAEDCLGNNYRQQIFDEMIRPTVIKTAEGQPVAKIADNDAVIFFNFRSDRALQLTRCFTKPESLPEKLPSPTLQNLYFATMTEYAPDLGAQVAFPPVNLKNNLAEVIAHTHLTQFHIAESEKYAHVTAFFNCGLVEKLPGEERVIVTSPENSRNYVDHPEMSAVQLTEILTEKIAKTDINFFVANYANADMVGHTGSLKAATLAVESLDGCLKKIVETCLLADAALLITADHGNCEQMINPKTGDIDKDHTTNPVPFLLVANEFKFPAAGHLDFASLAARVPEGVISDVAPTVLELFGLPKPKEMTGVSLLGALEH